MLPPLSQIGGVLGQSMPQRVYNMFFHGDRQKLSRNDCYKQDFSQIRGKPAGTPTGRLPKIEGLSV